MPSDASWLIMAAMSWGEASVRILHASEPMILLQGQLSVSRSDEGFESQFEEDANPLAQCEPTGRGGDRIVCSHLLVVKA